MSCGGWGERKVAKSSSHPKSFQPSVVHKNLVLLCLDQYRSKKTKRCRHPRMCCCYFSSLLPLPLSLSLSLSLSLLYLFYLVFLDFNGTLSGYVWTGTCICTECSNHASSVLRYGCVFVGALQLFFKEFSRYSNRSLGAFPAASTRMSCTSWRQNHWVSKFGVRVAHRSSSSTNGRKKPASFSVCNERVHFWKV